MSIAKLDPRIDAYIAKAAPFAQPILRHVRDAVHAACPGVEETIKWGSPSFVYADGILCGMAAFKQHASFGYWKHTLVVGADAERTGMGSYGKLTSVADQPPHKRLIADIRKAMKLNEAGVATPRPKSVKPAPVAPPDLVAALAKNRKAKAVFEAFAPGHRREYIEWIMEAKREETRRKRLAQAVLWLAEGKSRNWKYQDC